MILCMQSECVIPYVEELELELKLSSSMKSVTDDKFITKKHKELVSNDEITLT